MTADNMADEEDAAPLLYYRTKQDIDEYMQKPVSLKLQWLQAQMEFFHCAMTEKAKRIREQFRNGQLS